MTPLIITAIAFVAAILIGFTAVWGTPVIGVPIVLIALLIIGAAHIRRRAERASDVREFRRQARADKMEADDRDRRTTVR